MDIWSLASSSSTLSSTSLNDRDPDPSPSSSAFLATTLAPSVAFLSSSASRTASSSAAAASAMIAACAAASHAAAASASAPDVSRGVHNPLCSLASSSVAGALDRGDFLIPTRGEKPPLASTFSAMFSELPYCVCCERMPGDVGWDAGCPSTTILPGDDLGVIVGDAICWPNTDCSCESMASIGDVGVPLAPIRSGRVLPSGVAPGGRPRCRDEIHRSRSNTVPARITRTLYPCVLQHRPYSRCM